MGRHPSVAAGVAVTAGVLVFGGGWLANAATTPDPVNACVTKSSGQVRIVATTGQCKSNEAPLTWSVQGPQGLPGTDGTDGTNGTNGTDGVSGYESTYTAFQTVATETTSGLWGTVVCPAGKVALGGGGIAFDGDVTASRPVNTNTDGGWGVENANGWAVQFARRDGSMFVTGSSVTGSVFVTCAAMTP